MATKTQIIAKPAAKTASRIVSTNDAARAKAQAANLPATNLQASAKVNAARAAARAAAKPAAKPATTPAVKPAVKAAAESAQAPSIVAMIVEGIAKRIEAKSPFYATALSYHARNKTQFPRARNNETRAALKVEDVAQVFDMHDKKILASGNAKGQAMFDVYMMQRT